MAIHHCCYDYHFYCYDGGDDNDYYDDYDSSGENPER